MTLSRTLVGLATATLLAIGHLSPLAWAEPAPWAAPPPAPAAPPASTQAPQTGPASTLASPPLPEGIQLPVPPLPEGSLIAPTPEQLAAARNIAALPVLPPELSEAIVRAVDFLEGTHHSPGDGAPLPADAPHVAEFYWPTAAGECIGGTLASVGTAIGVPGPAPIPAPAPGEGQTTFLFTGLGTAPAAAEQGGMHVHWINLTTLASGIETLDNNGINAEGPGTLSAVANTGKGTIVAAITGTMATTDSTCTYLPTAGVINAQ